METNSSDDYGLASTSFLREPDFCQQIDKDVGQTLEVFVIFTDVPGTLAALRTAAALSKQLAAHLQLLMPYEVPYTLPVLKPAVQVEFLEGRVRDLACKTHLDVAAHICLCRDRSRVLRLLLRPRDLIVLGGRKRWWPSRAERLAKALRRNGYQVIFVEAR